MISVLLPRNRPPPSIESRRSKPAETRSVEALCLISAGAGPLTSIPLGPMRRGNSPAANPDPRYFVIWSRCTETPCSNAALQPDRAIDHELHEAVVRDLRLMTIELWP